MRPQNGYFWNRVIVKRKIFKSHLYSPVEPNLLASFLRKPAESIDILEVDEKLFVLEYRWKSLNSLE